MNKKVGKFKLWQLIALGAAIGFAVYVYKRRGGGVNPEEVVGGTGTGAFGPIDPNTGIPYAFESGAGGGGAGESLSNFLGKVEELREAGFFGTPEREVLREEVPEHIETQGEPQGGKAKGQGKKGKGKAAGKGTSSAKAKAKKATHAARVAVGQAQVARGAHRAAHHQVTHKPHSTGAAAHVPANHVAPAHPAYRPPHHKKRR